MHRNHLLNLLNQYYPKTPEEITFKSQIIDFVSNHKNCFERSSLVGHITASAWILDPTGNKALLTHHKKLNDWFQLGGHCDGNPNVLEMALQEAREEAGLEEIIPLSLRIFDIDVHLIPESPKEPAHYHYDIRFLLQVDTEKPVQHNSESKELRWIEKDISQLPSKSRSLMRMFDKWTSLEAV